MEAHAAEAPAVVKAELCEVLTAGGITKVALIRHSNAQPRDPEAAAVEAGGTAAGASRPPTRGRSATWSVGSPRRARSRPRTPSHGSTPTSCGL